MEAHQQRVIDEKDELEAKGSKLSKFIGTDTFNSLSDAEKYLLKRQDALMQEYFQVLQARIAIFGK